VSSAKLWGAAEENKLGTFKRNRKKREGKKKYDKKGEN
jgi:hypothetical protein